MGMKKVRVLLAVASMATAIVVGNAGPASANCQSEPPVDACNVLIYVCEKAAKLQSNCETW
jgi:hypothetical protein